MPQAFLLFEGRSGMYRGSSDLTVAYLSGVEQCSGSTEDSTRSSENPFFSASDVDSFLQSVTSKANFQGVDLLLTSQWPLGVEKYGIALVSLLPPIS